MPARIARIDGPDAFADAFEVSRETVDRLATYEALLRKWQKAVNLVAPGTLDDIWHRHFADSAQLLALAPEAKSWLDLGSGGGFPGMVIAILLANHGATGVHLVESNARKCAFLGEVSRATGTAVEIHNARIESLALTDRVLQPDVITARALAPLDRLLDQAMPFLNSGGRCIFLKGRSADRELEAALRSFDFDAAQHPSRTEADARIVEIAALRRKGQS